MELKAIRCEDVGTTRVVLLSRPHRRNAWTGRMHTEYRWTLEQAEADDAVKVVLVTGDPEGGAFSVGADSGALEGHAERGGAASARTAELILQQRSAVLASPRQAGALYKTFGM